MNDDLPGLARLIRDLPEGDGHNRSLRTSSEENVALRLAWEMRRRGWSQDRMAQELTNAGQPMHQSAISKIVNSMPDGRRRTISVDEAIAMARVFGISVGELLRSPHGAEGRDLHRLSRAVVFGGGGAREQCANFIFAWACLRYQLSRPENQRAYQRYLKTRRADAATSREGIETWLAERSWREMQAAYATLEQVVQNLGGESDLTPLTADRRWRHSTVADLVRLRHLFAGQIPSTEPRSVPLLIEQHAPLLIRAGVLQAALPVFDAYTQGTPCPTADVVADIDQRLQHIIDRKPQGRLDYLESLAARIALQWKGDEGTQQQRELAAELGASMQDYTDAMKIGSIPRGTGVLRGLDRRPAQAAQSRQIR
ncbi:helix-turn-helix domain-containing protein [Nonomuraea jabiensis]|uniref:helix-turn-helix domain-containing protein n=1 Tax=Nonomuraea jabiensis TaxID=882448 RepID=UPI003D71E63B